MNYGIAISTYFNENINYKRLPNFQKCITSLLDSNVDAPIFVVDDGSTIKTHLEIIPKDSRISIIEKDINGGYSKIKNSGIKKVLDAGCDFVFLLDDDVHIINKDWCHVYIKAYNQTRIPHFCFYDNSYMGVKTNKGEIKSINGYDIILTPLVQGGMMTFTKELIDTVGYFKVFPEKLGHEHTHFTNKLIHKKIISGYTDIVDSDLMLRYIDSTGDITTRPDNFCYMASVNEKFLYSDYDIVEKCNE